MSIQWWPADSAFRTEVRNVSQQRRREDVVWRCDRVVGTGTWAQRDQRGRVARFNSLRSRLAGQAVGRICAQLECQGNKGRGDSSRANREGILMETEVNLIPTEQLRSANCAGERSPVELHGLRLKCSSAEKRVNNRKRPNVSR